MKTNKNTNAADRAFISNPNPADRALHVARYFAEHGALPSDVSTFWRDLFTHGYGRVPADVRKAFGLAPTCGWGDVLREIDAKLSPRQKGQPLAGWSEGSAADARAQREADRKAVRHASAPVDYMPPPAPYNSNPEAAS